MSSEILFNLTLWRGQLIVSASPAVLANGTTIIFMLQHVVHTNIISSEKSCIYSNIYILMRCIYSNICILKHCSYTNICILKHCIYSNICILKRWIYYSICILKCCIYSNICILTHCVYSNICILKRRIYSNICIFKSCTQIGLVRSRANLVQDLSPGAGEVARGHAVTWGHMIWTSK